ncbi:cryptochrome/photolyase family protein [Arcobacter roscoffensis]|uniref:DNA photolyase family protein n=1 Tax=Arcobacter roscoffensis TaxID=2961520 RepID=A0ABY5E1C5_9BACT|nr:deoxyribodipyrimidine photo-lyase [Arcobacter roscoffensis]UTJ05349.1 DNA photolyase family protein [Arcobacter roscoffensis]
MKQILWFRRDLRVTNSALLSKAKDEVMPIFIFDTDILNSLDKEDKRVSFIYKSVLSLKKQLKALGLDLAIFYGKPIEIFSKLKPLGFDEILCSCDFDDYAKKRDEQVDKIITLRRYSDSYIIKPWNALKKDGTPYKVFTPFYKNLSFIWESDALEEFEVNKDLKLITYDYEQVASLESMGFDEVELPSFLNKTAHELIEEFSSKIEDYEEQRDIFYKSATSSLAVHLRFGLISSVEVFNKIKKLKGANIEFFIRELFWREFYNYILFHFPKSEFENFNGLEVSWNQNEEDFERWCEGKTGVPLIDAAMIHFNKTGTMHNRLRMIVSSFLTKNLLIDWKKGERYFASKLLDYDASSNIGSWQWAASTGADSVPYFRIFNPYTQSAKFDKEGLFIKSVIPELKDVDPKLFHKEGALANSLFVDYIKPIVSIELSRKRALEAFKGAKNEKA